MKYIVWRVTETDFVEEGRYNDYVTACLFKFLFEGCVKKEGYLVITPEGETPVW